MLYETPGARSRDFDTQADAIPSSKGLGALTPHVANKRSSGSGGGFGVLSVGAGSGVSTGTPLTGSTGPNFRTTGRNTFAVKIGMKNKMEIARGKYQASAIAARASTKGDDFVAPSNATGAAGLSGIFNDPFNPHSWMPPGGKLNRIQPFGQSGINIARILPTPVRSAIRYAGAGVQSLIAPVLSGSQQRRVFGLSANESRIFQAIPKVEMNTVSGAATGAAVGFMTGGPAGAIVGAVAGGVYGLGKGIYGQVEGAPEGRTIYQTLLPAAVLGGSAGFVTGQIVASQQAAALAHGANVINSGAFVGPVATPTFVGPVAPGAFDPIASTLASTPVSGIPAATATNTAFDPIAGTLQGSTVIPPAGMKLATGVAAESGLLSSAESAGAFVGKTLVMTAATGYLQSMLIPKPGMTGQGGASPLDLGYQAPQAPQAPQGGGFMPTFSGGGSSAPTDSAPVEASLMSPSLLLGGAIVSVGIFMLLKRRKRAA